MKKIIITIMLAIPMLASAEKFVHINTQELFAQMPEYEPEQSSGYDTETSSETDGED